MDQKGWFTYQERNLKISLYLWAVHMVQLKCLMFDIWSIQLVDHAGGVYVLIDKCNKEQAWRVADVINKAVDRYRRNGR